MYRIYRGFVGNGCSSTIRRVRYIPFLDEYVLDLLEIGANFFDQRQILSPVLSSLPRNLKPRSFDSSSYLNPIRFK